VFCIKRRQGRNEHPVDQQRHRREADESRGIGVLAADPMLEAMDFLLDLRRPGYRHLSRLRRMERTIHAFEQPGAERRLRRGEPPRDGGLIDAKPARRRRQRAGARNGQDVAEVVPVHGLAFLQIGSANISIFLQD